MKIIVLLAFMSAAFGDEVLVLRAERVNKGALQQTALSFRADHVTFNNSRDFICKSPSQAPAGFSDSKYDTERQALKDLARQLALRTGRLSKLGHDTRLGNASAHRTRFFINDVDVTADPVYSDSVFDLLQQACELKYR